eukprot:s2413_g2.t1
MEISQRQGIRFGRHRPGPRHSEASALQVVPPDGGSRKCNVCAAARDAGTRVAAGSTNCRAHLYQHFFRVGSWFQHLIFWPRVTGPTPNPLGSLGPLSWRVAVHMACCCCGALA